MWPTPVIPMGMPLPPEDLVPQEARMFKVNPCRNFHGKTPGTCKFGAKCNFAHGVHEQRQFGFGPTPEEAHSKGQYMSPALKAWWQQARNQLAQQNGIYAQQTHPQRAQQPLQHAQVASAGIQHYDAQEDEDLRRLREQFPEEFQQQMELEQHRRRQGVPLHTAAPLNGVQGLGQNVLASRPEQHQQQPSLSETYEQVAGKVDALNQKLAAFVNSNAPVSEADYRMWTVCTGLRNAYKSKGEEMVERITELDSQVSIAQDHTVIQQLEGARDAATNEYLKLAPLFKTMNQLWKQAKKRMDASANAPVTAPAPPAGPAPTALVGAHASAVPAAAVVLPRQAEAPAVQPAPQATHAPAAIVPSTATGAGSLPVQQASSSQQPAASRTASAQVTDEMANAPPRQYTVAGVAKSLFNATMQAAASASSAFFTGEPASRSNGASSGTHSGTESVNSNKSAASGTTSLQSTTPGAVASIHEQQFGIPVGKRHRDNEATQPKGLASTAAKDAAPIVAAPPQASTVQPTTTKPTPSVTSAVAARETASKPAAVQPAPTKPTVVAAAPPPAAAAVKATAAPSAAATKTAAAAAKPAAATDTAVAKQLEAASSAASAAKPTAAQVPAAKQEAAKAATQQPAKQQKPGSSTPAPDSSAKNDVASTRTAAAVPSTPATKAAAAQKVAELRTAAATKDTAVQPRSDQSSPGSTQPGSQAAPVKDVVVQPVKAAAPSKTPVVPSQVFPEAVVKQATLQLNVTKAVHQKWAVLYKPIIHTGSFNVLKQAVDALTDNPAYKHAEAAGVYLDARLKGLGTAHPGIKDWMRANGIMDDYLMDDMPGWRTAPVKVGFYICALVWELALADEAELMDRVDIYMGLNQRKQPTPVEGEPVLTRGCWKTWKRDGCSLVSQLIRLNKVKVLTWAMTSYSLDALFEADKASWKPVRNSSDPSTGMYTWGKSLGAGPEILEAMITPWVKQQRQLAQQSKAKARAPAAIKEQMAVVTSIVQDGLPPELARQALESTQLSVQWNPDNAMTWTLEANKPGSFLHLVLHLSQPELCAGLVQVAVDRLADEIMRTSTPTSSELRQGVSYYVRQKDFDGQAPLMIVIERCTRSAALAKKLPEVLQQLLIHGADPLNDNFAQLVETTPMHTLIVKVDKGAIDQDSGAKAIGLMAKYAKPAPGRDNPSVDDPGLDNVLVTNSGQRLMNVLAAAINSTAGAQKLVEALVGARPDMNPVKLLQLGEQAKEYQTPLSMALVAKGQRPARPEVGKLLLACWKPNMLLAAMDSRQPKEHRDAVKKLLQENKATALAPLANLGEQDIKPLLDAALAEQGTHLMELLLKHVPSARFESLDLVNRPVPLECMEELARRGAHAHLGPLGAPLPEDSDARHAAKVDFLQKYLTNVLSTYAVPQEAQKGSLPNDPVVFDNRWGGKDAKAPLFAGRENSSYKLNRLLSVKDQDNLGPLSKVYLPGCKVKAACLFGRGLGAGRSTAALLKTMLDAGTVDPNERDPARCGMTLLHLAAADSAADAVKALVAAGADVLARIEPRVIPESDTAAGSAADKKGAAKKTAAPEPGLTLDTIHDNLTGFTPLHVAVKVCADLCSASKLPLDESYQNLEYLTQWVAASGRSTLDNLLHSQPREQAQARAPLSKGKKGATARGVLAGLDRLTEMYDNSYKMAAENEKARDEAAAAAAAAAARHARPDPANVTDAASEAITFKSSVGLTQRTSAASKQEQLEKDLQISLMAGGPGPGVMPICDIITAWASLPVQKQDSSLGVLVKCMSMDTAPSRRTLNTAAGVDSSGLSEEEQAREATYAAMRNVVGTMMPDELPVEDEEEDPNAVYSDDDPLEAEEPNTAAVQTAKRPVKQASQEEEPVQRELDPETALQDLTWMFTITKEARQSWACLQPHARNLVLKRLREMGKGLWQRAGGVKRLTDNNEQLRGLDLWRLKIDKGGRILFEVAVEYDEEKQCWSECLRLWCITISHKKYEECILKVHDSYRRSQQVNEKRKLQAMLPDAQGGGGVHESRDAVRLPRTFRDVGNNTAMMAVGATAAIGGGKGSERAKATGPEREHLPPANYDPEQFTLLKMYNVDVVLLQTVMQGLTDAKVELPFKVSPIEWEIITRVPKPPCSTILLGRSGTGKTTCAVYRMWAKWLAGYKEWIPGQQAIAAAGAADAAQAAGDAEAAAIAADFAAKTIGGTTVFVTASATLKETVKKAFRKMQMAAMKPDEYKAVEAAGRVVYHSFKGVPPEAFPMFLTARQYLEMVDASTSSPFFKRRSDGSILKAQNPGEIDRDCADVMINLEFDEEQDDDFEEDEENNLRAEEVEELEEDAEQAIMDFGGGIGGDEGIIYQAPATLAGKVSVAKEVTWLHFRNSLWPKITTPEQRSRLQPGLVWAEICSYIKGSMEAISHDFGHLDLESYKNIGGKRAANFTPELREKDIWPIFVKYQMARSQEMRYDIMDFVSHMYSELKTTGYQGVPISALYRDEVQDFTQAELALDLRVIADPNSLFYCGDTAQTIARGVGFRFSDITTLLHTEGVKRREAQEAQKELPKQKGRNNKAAAVGLPEILHLTTNYRTHQGILNTAAMVVDLIRMHYPNSIDKLEREKALFPGPDPILLAGTEYTDLTYLLCGTDRSNSQVEFGANQVILVRSMAAKELLPDEIRTSNALIMTVPQAKGLEFDDVFLFNFFQDSVADASEWRVLNQFVEDVRERQQDVNVMRDNPELLERFKTSHAKAQEVPKKEEGYLRPVSFDSRQHVLLQEELKHLYTAITRAKSNVVFFDLNKEKRAPFYNVLRSFGMARVVNRSLLDDGSDAKTFGLAHHAQDSKAEWFKRAKNLMEKGSPGLAEKAFRQAGDDVRAEIALARQLRLEAAGADYEDQHTTRAPLTQEQKRRKLHEVAFRCLLAVQHAEKAPVHVTPRELQRWVRLAAQCLTEVKQLAGAAQLHALVHNYKVARQLLQGLGEYRLLAQVCLRASEFYQAKATRAQASAHSARSQLMVSGANLAQMLSDTESVMARTAQQAEQDEQAAATATKLAHMYRARAAHAFWLGDDLEQSLRILRAHTITAEVLQVWPSVHKDVLKMSQVLQDVGKRDEARSALDMARDDKDKEEQLKRFGMWEELTAMRLRKGDVLGVVHVLMGQRQHLAAARMLLDLMIARGARLQRQGAKSMAGAAKLNFPRVDAAVDVVANQPVPSEAFLLLTTCVLALQSADDVASLQLPLAMPAAQEAGAQEAVQSLVGLGWLMEGKLPKQQGGTQDSERKPLDATTKEVLLASPGCIPFFEFQASSEQQLDAVARSMGLPTGAAELHVLAQHMFDCIQVGAAQMAQGTAEPALAGAGSSALEQALQHLQPAMTSLEGLAALQQLRQPTNEQQDALRHLELHYGVANRSPTSGVTRNLGATNLLSLDYSDVYLGNASYMWRSLAGMQPEPSARLSSRAEPEAPAVPVPNWEAGADAGPQFLPLHAPRPAVVQLLAWDVTRKAQAALVPVIYLSLVKQLAESVKAAGLLTSMSKMQENMSLLVSCLRACHRVQELCQLRNTILPVKKQRRTLTKGEVQVVSDSPIQPCAQAVSELAGAQEIMRQLEMLCVGLLASNSVPTAHPPGLCDFLDQFKSQELPRALTTPERFGAALFRLFDAGFPNNAGWQGVNFMCWWGLTILLQTTATTIQQRRLPSTETLRSMCIINAEKGTNRYLLPEEVLSVATERLYIGMTDEAIPNILTHIMQSVLNLCNECGASQASGASPVVTHQQLTPEPIVLLMEMVGGMLTLGVWEPAPSGNKDLRTPRAYMPSVCSDLVTDLPKWGVRQGVNPTWRGNDLMEYWQELVNQDQATKEVMVGHISKLLYLINALAGRLSTPGPALATVSQQQVLSLLTQHVGRERGTSAGAAASVLLLLPEPVQRMRGALLALRLARLTSCMLLSVELSHAAGAVCGKTKEAWLDLLSSDLRKVLARLLTVLKAPGVAEYLPDMTRHSDALQTLLGAAKVGEFMKASHAFVGSIKEITPTSVRDFTGHTGSHWKQVQATKVLAPAVKKQGSTAAAAGMDAASSSMAEMDNVQQSQATFVNIRNVAEQRHQSARVIQEAWRKHRAARRVEQERQELEARRAALLDTLRGLHDSNRSFRRGFASMHGRAVAVLEERRMQQLQAARQQALAEEAKKSDLLAAIRVNRTALDDVDGRLNSVGLTNTSCPVCSTVAPPSPVPLKAPAAQDSPATPRPAGAAASTTSPSGSGGKSFAAAAAAAAMNGGRQRLLNAAMRPMMAQTFTQHIADPSHSHALGLYQAFRSSYLDVVCPCMWWVEVLRVAADKTMQRLRAEASSASAAGAEPNSELLAVLTSLATQKAHLDELHTDLHAQLVMPALRAREWRKASCTQFAMAAVQVVLTATKKMLDAGQAEGLCAVMTAGRQGNEDWLPTHAEELEAREQAVKEGQIPEALVTLAKSLLPEAEINRLLGRQAAVVQDSDTATAEQPGAGDGGAAEVQPTSTGGATQHTPAPSSAGAIAAGLLRDAEDAMDLGKHLLQTWAEEEVAKDDEEEEEEENRSEEEDEWETVGKGRNRGAKGGMRGATGGSGSGPNARANRQRAGAGRGAPPAARRPGRW